MPIEVENAEGDAVNREMLDAFVDFLIQKGLKPQTIVALLAFGAGRSAADLGLTKDSFVTLVGELWDMREASRKIGKA